MKFLKFIQIDLITCNGKQTQSQNTSYYLEKINVIIYAHLQILFFNYLIPIFRKHKFGLTKLIINAKKNNHYFENVEIFADIFGTELLLGSLLSLLSCSEMQVLKRLNIYHILISITYQFQREAG